LKENEESVNSIFLSLFNNTAQEETRFTVLSNQGPFELRMYQKIVCAKISIQGSLDQALSEGARFLEDYIEGSNFKADRIKPYGPFFQVQRENGWEIGLILPSHYDLILAPKPINRFVKIEELHPTRVGVLRFRGSPTQDLILKRGAELKRWLTFKGLGHSGPLRITRQNSMYALPFFGHSEVHVNVF
jgi:hypothetical protein